MRRIEATTIRTVDLGYEQMLVLEDRRGARVQVLYGGIWLTEEGRSEDVFAGSGQTVALRSRKRALLEALGPTRIEVIEPVVSGIDAVWIRAKRAARRLMRLAGSTSGAGRRTATTAAL